MSKTDLGLPLEYQIYPEFFDALNINVKTEAKNKLITKLLTKNRVKTILDVSCGTGSQVFHLLRAGFMCTGVDISAPLIEQAKSKAAQEGIEVDLSVGDMRNVKAGQFDAIITIFNAIGHLTKIEFETALQNLYNSLNVGGVLMFDILNAQAMTPTVVSDLAYSLNKRIDDIQLFLVQCSTFDEKSGRLRSFDSYTYQKRSEKPKNIQHESSLQLYSSNELDCLLTDIGFKVIERVDLDGEAFVPEISLNMLTIARK